MSNAVIKASNYTIETFLAVPTPAAWVEWAIDNQRLLLWDHSNCEKKAASTALSLLFKYPTNTTLVYRMSRLAREELRHFEQVQSIVVRRDHEYEMVAAPQYASRLRTCVRHHEPQRLIDRLIVGAFIEARSCERFGQLVPHLDDELAKFYQGLKHAEQRHFLEYLNLAEDLCSGTELIDRCAHIAQVEAQAILEPSEHFAFHSGPPK